MLHNYHTHTFRNHHTVGTEREYIESAIKNGFQTLGFSEHAPYRFPDGHVSYFHMFPEDLNDYIQTLLTLKAEYAGRIEILIGYEAEYYPRFFDDLLARITQYPVDYLLLGQHYIHNEIDGVYVYEPTDDPEILKVYVNQCIAGLDTGLYTYLAHPDLIQFTGSESIYRQGNGTAVSGCEGTEYSAGAEPVGAAREPGVPLRTLFPDRKGLRQHDRRRDRRARPGLLLPARNICALSGICGGVRAHRNGFDHAPACPALTSQ